MKNENFMKTTEKIFYFMFDTLYYIKSNLPNENQHMQSLGFGKYFQIVNYVIQCN